MASSSGGGGIASKYRTIAVVDLGMLYVLYVTIVFDDCFTAVVHRLVIVLRRKDYLLVCLVVICQGGQLRWGSLSATRVANMQLSLSPVIVAVVIATWPWLTFAVSGI